MLRLVELINSSGTLPTLIDAHYNWSDFKGRLDTDRAVVAGHSMGSFTVMCALALTDKFKRKSVHDFSLNGQQFQWASASMDRSVLYSQRRT